MRLGFEESQATYISGAQSARNWTEAWVKAQAYCPHCGHPGVTQFPNNTPLSDFFCSSCSEEFELKSKRGKFGNAIANGAYQTKCDRLAASNNPNLLLMNYDLQTRSVVNLFIIPKHFFVRDIIQERRPLSPKARRAGWIGSNILIGKIPESGRIHIVRDGVVRPKDLVLEEWHRTLFLRQQTLETRGWLLEVMNCIESFERPEFSLDDVYSFEQKLSQRYPDNQNIRPKIRQQLQYLRDRGLIEFVAKGRYRLRK